MENLLSPLCRKRSQRPYPAAHDPWVDAGPEVALGILAVPCGGVDNLEAQRRNEAVAGGRAGLQDVNVSLTP
jgi:hypothetical protein